MTIQLQLLLIFVSIFVFFFILKFIRKNKLSTDMAVVWILWALGLIIISLVPQIVYAISKLLGIMAPINTVFLIMTFILYCLVFFLYLKLSVLEDKLKSLIQYTAIRDKDSENKC